MSLTRADPSQPARCGAVVALGCAVFVCLALGGTALAETTTFEGVAAPIVRINVREGDVTIRTWDRAAVAIDGSQGLDMQRRAAHVPVEQIPLFIPGAGAVTSDGRQLPAESFVVSSIPYGPRDQIVIKSPPLSREAGALAPALTVTVPADAVFVSARTGSGNLDVHDYRGGTFVGFAGRGRLELHGVGGTAFVQTGRGPLSVADSSFDRLRARSLGGNMTFERCRVRQIEATSVDGSIVYDGGSFEPGLARFESARGDVAIGTSGGAQIGAHTTGSGKVFTSFEHAARVEGQGANANAIVAGGGPVVTAATQSGNIFLYDGSLRGRGRALPARFGSPLETLQRPAERAPSGGAVFGPRAAPSFAAPRVVRPAKYAPPGRVAPRGMPTREAKKPSRR